ncbi:MAG: hypothetical protein WCI05_12005 [Myxococcales bacterium]|jgi:hypothetical protein
MAMKVEPFASPVTTRPAGVVETSAPRTEDRTKVAPKAAGDTFQPTYVSRGQGSSMNFDQASTLASSASSQISGQPAAALAGQTGAFNPSRLMGLLEPSESGAY